MIQLLYSVFLSNNQRSFHFCWKENFVKSSKSLKILWKWFSKRIILLFMSLLTFPNDRNSYIWAGIYSILLGNFLKQTWQVFIAKFWYQWKDSKRSYKLRQILEIFWKLIALIFGQNSVKGLRVTIIVREINFERIKRKKVFPDTTIHKIFKTNYGFYVK